MKARVITITSALLLLLAHSTAAIKFSSHKYSVSEVSSFTEEMWKAKFEAFMAKYGKSYATTEEYNKRFNAYKVNDHISQRVFIHSLFHFHFFRPTSSKLRNPMTDSHMHFLGRTRCLTTPKKIGLGSPGTPDQWATRRKFVAVHTLMLTLRVSRRSILKRREKM